MANNLRVVELNPFRVLKADLEVLAGLPIDMDVQTAEMFEKQIARQEQTKIWVGMMFVWTTFLITGFLCAGCNSEDSGIWIVLAIPALLFMLLQRSISNSEIKEVIQRRTRDMVIQELQKVQEFMTTNPFVSRREMVIYENLPQLMSLGTLIDKCKRESQIAAQRLLQFKSMLNDKIPSGSSLEVEIHRPEVKRLQLRVQIYTELMESFEKCYATMMKERNRLYSEREKVRRAAQNEINRENPPAPFVQAYVHRPLQSLNTELYKSMETSLSDTVRLGKSAEYRWRLLVESMEKKEHPFSAENVENKPPQPIAVEEAG